MTAEVQYYNGKWRHHILRMPEQRLHEILQNYHPNECRDMAQANLIAIRQTNSLVVDIRATKWAEEDVHEKMT